ncbi:MAG: NAD(P)H-binding protein [Cyclobacteriaceae bacterium]|nr:NAD(P)H-binding protein [Cyclobacteriaceae bacterium]
MTTLIVGASGATGSLVVNQLLDKGVNVRVIVRSPDKIPDTWKNSDMVHIIYASISEIGADDMAKYVEDCDAVVSCLGHNLSFKGIYGKPRRLVTNVVRNLCEAIKKRKAISKPVKFVLMNTTGNRNKNLQEPISPAHKMAIALIRLLLPPHVDNEKAAEYLRVELGQNDRSIAWVAVRPDSLINASVVSAYEVHPSPTRNPIFDAGTTSRINVANFMAELLTRNELWEKWKGQMPVIYNKPDIDRNSALRK